MSPRFIPRVRMGCRTGAKRHREAEKACNEVEAPRQAVGSYHKRYVFCKRKNCRPLRLVSRETLDPQGAQGQTVFHVKHLAAVMLPADRNVCPTMQISGNTFLVTGGSAGLGAACVRMLVEAG